MARRLRGLTSPARRELIAAAFALLAATVAAAGDMAAEIRSDKVDYFLSAAFAKYGPESRRTVQVEKSGVRFRVANLPKGQGHVGVQSHFTLTGDFEVGVDYEVISMSQPSTGTACRSGSRSTPAARPGAVFVQRENHPEQKQCVMVTRETPKTDGSEGKDYAADSFPAVAARGRLVVRRQGEEVVCLAGEKGASPVELKRVPFGPDAVSYVRLFADTGGAELPIDARLLNLSIKADAITGLATPPSVGWHWTSWLLLASVVTLLVYAVLFVVRRRRREREDD